MSAHGQRGPATTAHIVTYAAWQKEMEAIAELAARAGVTAPTASASPSLPTTATAASVRASPPSLVAPSWDRLLSSLHQYPYGAAATSRSHHNNTNSKSGSGGGHAATAAGTACGADALLQALSRVDQLLTALAHENRVTDLASSQTAEAQTLMYRALLFHHAHQLFQQQIESVMAYEQATDGQAASPNERAGGTAVAAAAETYAGLVAQVAQLYAATTTTTTTTTSTTTNSVSAVSRGRQNHTDTTRRSSGSSSGATPSRTSGSAPLSSSSASSVIDPLTHILPSSSATAAAAQAHYQFLTAGSHASEAAILPAVPYSRTHPNWLAHVQRRQSHFLRCEARDYQRASRLWMRVEQERLRFALPTQDDALAMSVVCTTMACGVLLRDGSSEAAMPYSRWQYERAARRVLDGSAAPPSGKEEEESTCSSTELPMNGAVRCVHCGGCLPVAAPPHLATITSSLAGLARELEQDFACQEQAATFYELAAVVVLQQVPSWWTVGVALASDEAVAHAVVELERHQEAAKKAKDATSTATTTSNCHSGPAAVAAVLPNTSSEPSSWWGGLVSQITSTFTREPTLAAETPEALQARREREQCQRQVRAQFAKDAAARWRAVGGVGTSADTCVVYHGYWHSFEVAMEGAIRCAAQCQEYTLALVYTDVLLDALAARERVQMQTSARASRLCWCPSAVWRRRYAESGPAQKKNEKATATTAQACDDEKTRSDSLAAYSLVPRTRCLVRRILMHLVLHDDRPAGTPVEEETSTSSGGESVWARRAKQQVRWAADQQLVEAVSQSLFELIDLVDLMHVGEGARTTLIGAATAHDVWMNHFLYPSTHASVPSSSNMQEPPVVTLPAVCAPSPPSSSASPPPSSSSPSTAQRVFAHRTSAAYAALKQRACAAEALTTRSPEPPHAETGGETRAPSLTHFSEPATTLSALWSITASLVALSSVVADSCNAPLQHAPESLLPLDVSSAEDEEATTTAWAQRLACRDSGRQRAEPAAVRRAIDAHFDCLERALWRLGISDAVFGALQQRVRSKLFFPLSLQQ